MDEGIRLSIADLQKELFENAKAEGVTNEESFAQLAETLIQEKLDEGLMHDDNPLEMTEDHLKEYWSQYQEENKDDV